MKYRNNPQRNASFEVSIVAAEIKVNMFYSFFITTLRTKLKTIRVQCTNINHRTLLQVFITQHTHYLQRYSLKFQLLATFIVNVKE